MKENNVKIEEKVNKIFLIMKENKVEKVDKVEKIN